MHLQLTVSCMQLLIGNATCNRKLVYWHNSEAI